MPIMLINILIAMMGNTYTTVIAQAEKAWRQQVNIFFFLPFEEEKKTFHKNDAKISKSKYQHEKLHDVAFIRTFSSFSI